MGSMFTYLDECILERITPTDYKEHLRAYCEYSLREYSIMQRVLQLNPPGTPPSTPKASQEYTQMSSIADWSDALKFLGECFRGELLCLVKMLREVVRGRGTPNTLQQMLPQCVGNNIIIADREYPQAGFPCFTIVPIVDVLFKELSLPSAFFPGEYYIVGVPFLESVWASTIGVEITQTTKLCYQGYGHISTAETIVGSALAF